MRNLELLDYTTKKVGIQPTFWLFLMVARKKHM